MSVLIHRAPIFLWIILTASGGRTQEENGNDSSTRKFLSKALEFIKDSRERVSGMIAETGKVMAASLAAFPARGGRAIQTADVDDVRGEAARAEYVMKVMQAAGKDVSPCIVDESRKADNIQEIALHGMKKCYADSQQVEADIKKSLKLLMSEIQLQLDRSEKELLSCLLLSNITVDINGELEVSECLVAKMKQLQDKWQGLIYSITEKLLNAQQKADEMLHQATVCLENEERKALQLEHDLLKEIEECIKRLP